MPARGQSKGELATVLVAMPFVSILHPSIQLGLLAAVGRAAGHAVDTLHLNCDLAAAIGTDLYQSLCRHRGCQVGDWMFSAAAFGDEAPDPGHALAAAFPDAVSQLADEAGISLERLIEVRETEIPAYLDRLEADIPWADYDVVGFTSTFQQSVASIALARRIKRSHPGVVTLFGGANLEGEMGQELVLRVPEIDYAIDGEGDSAFPEFLSALAGGSDPAKVPGVISRAADGVHVTPPRPPRASLDELPFPDYDEYFERIRALGLLEWARKADLALPLEGSRGCWWGAVRHCTFCGLNGESMAYRSRSTAKVLEELAYQSARHRIFHFEAADNIVPQSAHRDLFPALEATGADYRFFFEIKANQRRQQVHQMKRAGVESIQPGIESLSTYVLKLMRKGVRAIDNVNLLRWAAHYGLDVSWNILWGFPGEDAEDYAQQAELVAWLGHLQPPASVARIWLERFSPLYVDREAFPAGHVNAEQSYRYVYPDGFDHDRVAYFFDFAFENTIPREPTLPLQDGVVRWRERWHRGERPQLRYRATPGLVEIEDARQPGDPVVYHLEGPLAELYVACSDRPHRPEALAKNLSLEDPAPSEEEVAGALDLFCEKGLMMRDDGLFLSLALPATTHR